MKGFKNNGKLQGIVVDVPKIVQGKGNPVEFTLKILDEISGATGKEIKASFFNFRVYDYELKRRVLSTIQRGCRADMSFKLASVEKNYQGNIYYSIYPRLVNFSVLEMGVENDEKANDINKIKNEQETYEDASSEPFEAEDIPF